MMTQKHLEHVAVWMNVCIHVLCFEAMGKETMRNGDCSIYTSTNRRPIITRCTRYTIYRLKRAAQGQLQIGAISAARPWSHLVI
jgi:hypothetical protein